MNNKAVCIFKGKAENRLSKETLNHRELIRLASGLDPLEDTSQAYIKAYAALGIDFINRVPDRNCPVPLNRGETNKLDETYKITSLGVYDSFYRYAYPYQTVDDFLNAEKPEKIDYHTLKTPVPHLLDIDDIYKRESLIGDVGCYYYQLYTTLFMWGVEHLGWEVFLMAIAMDPEFVDRYLLQPGFEQTLKYTDILLQSSGPYLFYHDDIAVSTGLVCQKEWMDSYLFPRYEELWAKVHAGGKQVVFVSDGNVKDILSDIKLSGVDGVMLENPATPFSDIVEVFGDCLIIGGINTELLSGGNPEGVVDHVHETMRTAAPVSKFALSSCGGLHDGIPIRNLEAYFDVRAEYGINRRDWRAEDRK